MYVNNNKGTPRGLLLIMSHILSAPTRPSYKKPV